MQTLKEGRRISIKSRRGEERTLRKEGRKKMLELSKREKRAQRKKIERKEKKALGLYQSQDSI